jgi:hypothetical protein
MDVRQIVGLSLVVLLGFWGIRGLAESSVAQEPGWSRSIILSGPERQELNQIDPRFRPYRPFHFFGNSYRRAYYRGNPMPTLDDLGQGIQSVLPAPQGPPPPPPMSF